MVFVHHRRDAIETETVKFELFHPVSQVRQQKSQDFPLAVVEASRIPHPVVTLRTAVEVLAIGAIEHVDTIRNVRRRVRVNQIHQNGNAHGVRFVNQILQLVRRTASRGNAEEVRHVVAKRSIIRVFLNRHQLNRVVP